MLLADLCIRRPVLATMLVSTGLVMGAFSFKDLGVDLFPRVDLPNIVITTTFRGAGPEEVETQITKVIEEAVNTVEGIDELRSQSFEGLSQVVVIFKLSRDPDAAAQDVRDRVGRVVARLPQGVDPPVIEKFDPDAAPVLTIVVSSPMPIRDLTEFAKRRIKESLESVSGVGQITLVGGREREVHIDVDGDRLKAYGLTAQDIKQALQRQNVELPGGLVETGPRDLSLRTAGRIERPEDFGNIVVREVGGIAVKVSDVARVTDSQAEQRTLARLDGKGAIALVVQKQSGTNTVEVVRAVKARLASLAPIFPEGTDVTTARDQSRFILASFHAVLEHLILGAVLASLVVLLFLGDVRTTIMVALSIPTSIITTFALMRYMDFTLNRMTLLALTLSVGLVIDDAIVVHENAFRHMEELGKDRRRATSDAAAEIGLAVMATTLSLVVIFLPVAFMPGTVGRFLQSFGLTMSCAIMVSLLVSFTMTPMLCSHFLKLHGGRGASRAGLLNRVLEGGYGWLLERSMRHRWLVVGLSAACMVSTAPLLQRVGRDFIPQDDQSEFMINVRAPDGTSLARTAETLARIEARLRTPEYQGIARMLATIGEAAGSASSEGQIYVAMTDLKERMVSQFAVMSQVREMLRKRFPELITSVSVVPLLSGGGFKQVDLNLSLQGPDLDKLRAYSDEILKEIRSIPGVVDLDSSLRIGKPEVRVELDRLRAASLGVDLADVASSLRTLVGGDSEEVTKYKDRTRGEEYEVRVRLAAAFRDRAERVAELPVKARDGMLPLSSIATVREGIGPTQIDRYGRQRQVGIFANLHGTGLGDAQKRVDARLRTMTFEPGYAYLYLGRSKVMREQNYGFMLAFLLSTIFVYMILAAQFESFVHPVTILLALPLCLPFGILSLFIVGERMNLWSTLGLFMLFGIVKKNSILQVDYTNVLRERGVERPQAILQANRTRLRPILMTTATLVAGMIPMSVGTGPGAATLRSTAIVVIGGQTLCLLITLLLTPVAYSIFDDIAGSRLVKRLQRALD
jgi:HAE1 family hydrophobic/amphiphilic exporter-1